MILMHEDELHIIIKGVDPETERESILEAISGAMRWFAMAKDERYDMDDILLYSFAHLLEAMLHRKD